MEGKEGKKEWKVRLFLDNESEYNWVEMSEKIVEAVTYEWKRKN